MTQGFDHDVTNVVMDTLLSIKADLESQIAGVVGGGDPQVITDLQADVAAIELTLGTLSTTVAGKASAAALTSGLAGKANSSDVSSALGTKADTSYVDAQLATKAVASAVATSLADKVSTSTYDAFVSATNSALSGKAAASALTTLSNTVGGHTTTLAAKADKTYVDAQLATKATVLQLDTGEALPGGTPDGTLVVRTTP
jgi:hypothetical protein